LILGVPPHIVKGCPNEVAVARLLPGERQAVELASVLLK
jgi:hypothetical protein